MPRRKIYGGVKSIGTEKQKDRDMKPGKVKHFDFSKLSQEERERALPFALGERPIEEAGAAEQGLLAKALAETSAGKKAKVSREPRKRAGKAGQGEYDLSGLAEHQVKAIMPFLEGKIPMGKATPVVKSLINKVKHRKRL